MIFLIYIFLKSFHRKAPTDIVIIGGYGFGFGGGGVLETVETIRLVDKKDLRNSLCMIKPYPFRIESHAGTIFGNRPLVCGGNNPSKGSSNECKMYNPQTNEWTAMISMLTTKYLHDVVNVNEDIYVFGGYGGNSYQSWISMQLFSTGIWRSITNTPIFMRYHCAVKLDNNTILSTGGLDGSNVSK